MMDYYSISELFKYILHLMDEQKVFLAYKNQAKKSYNVTTKKKTKRNSRKISAGIILSSLKRYDSESKVDDYEISEIDVDFDIERKIEDQFEQQNKCIDIINLFIKYDPNIVLFQSKNLKNGRTLAMHAAKLDLVNIFIAICKSNPKVIDLKDRVGNTAIFYARLSRSFKCFGACIKELNAKLDIKNKDGETIFDVCKNADQKITKPRKASGMMDEIKEEMSQDDTNIATNQPFTSLLIHKYADNHNKKDPYLDLLENGNVNKA